MPALLMSPCAAPRPRPDRLLCRKDNPRIYRAMTASLLPRRLLFAILALFAAVLPACDGAMALGGPTDRFVIAPVSGKAKEVMAGNAQATITVLRKRLEAMGLAVHRLEPGEDGRIIMEVSGKDAAKAVAAAVGIKGDLAIRLVDLNALPYQVDQGIAPVGSEVLPMAEGGISVAVRRIGGISGDRIVAARPGIDQFTGEPMVMISFDEAGTRKFALLTGANVGNALAIVLDGKVLSTPIISEPITGGQAQIAGALTQESANAMAAAIGSGALPAAFTLVEHTAL